jgi:uncharacterized protein (DUF2249 family)/quercetin dioxygenase-like cupin family protein
MFVYELDVRSMRKPDKHPAIFQAYDTLAVGASFVLINNHDPKHLREEFDADYPGGYGWEYLDKGPETWRIQVSKRTSTAIPSILGDTHAIVSDARDPAATGAVWKLQMRRRDLDSNVVRLQPETRIDTHVGPDLDVLVIVLDGAGQLTTEIDTLDIQTGTLAWLPRRSQRCFTAGSDGLTYLTVHQRRQALALDPAPSRS